MSLAIENVTPNQRETKGLAENLRPALRWTSRHPHTDGVFDFLAVGSRYLLTPGNTTPNPNDLKPPRRSG